MPGQGILFHHAGDQTVQAVKSAPHITVQRYTPVRSRKTDHRVDRRVSNTTRKVDTKVLMPNSPRSVGMHDAKKRITDKQNLGLTD